MATRVTYLVTRGVMLHYSSPLKIVVVSLITQKVETTNVIKPGNVTASLGYGTKDCSRCAEGFIWSGTDCGKAKVYLCIP